MVSWFEEDPKGHLSLLHILFPRSLLSVAILTMEVFIQMRTFHAMRSKIS